MKTGCAKTYALCVSLLAAFSFTAAAQGSYPKSPPPSQVPKLSVDQQDALDLLKDLPRTLKSESDKPAAATLQARIADLLWTFDEPYAREVFRWSFDAARRPAPDDLPKAKEAAYVKRQAASIKEVLSRFSAHDRAQAEAWLKALEEEKTAAEARSQSNRFRSDLLIEIALQMVTSKPEQAQKLGLLSLTDNKVPEGFGRLLFSLANVDRGLSDGLFQAAVAALRRQGFVYDSSLVALTNYLFGPTGDLRSDGGPDAAMLLTNYFVEAAWHQITSPGDPLTDASASFFSFLEVRAVPIVARYSPERLPELRGQMRQIAMGMSQEQAQRTAALAAAQDQKVAISQGNDRDIDEQIDRAQKVRDSRLRDSLFISIAHSLIRQDATRALKIAAMIEDDEQRKPVEDDINLVRIQDLMSSRSYPEVKKIALLLNNRSLCARVLVELATRAISESKDAARATELLVESCDITAKAENTADKTMDYLIIGQSFATFDSMRGFECLAAAVKSVNKLAIDEPAPPTATTKSPLVRIKTYTVVNGREMSASDRSTPESIDFSQIDSLVRQDYMQARLLANTFEKSLWRAKYLTAVATAALSPPQDRGSNAATKQGLRNGR